jgi:hypothetical protein
MSRLNFTVPTFSKPGHEPSRADERHHGNKAFVTIEGSCRKRGNRGGDGAQRAGQDVERPRSVVVLPAGVRCSNERDLEAECRRQFDHRDDRHRHGDKTEVRWQQQASEDGGADDADRAIDQAKQDHPCGPPGDVTLHAPLLPPRFVDGSEPVRISIAVGTCRFRDASIGAA